MDDISTISLDSPSPPLSPAPSETVVSSTTSASGSGFTLLSKDFCNDLILNPCALKNQKQN